MAAARVGYDMADEQNRQIRWRHVALVKALIDLGFRERDADMVFSRPRNCFSNDDFWRFREAKYKVLYIAGIGKV